MNQRLKIGIDLLEGLLKVSPISNSPTKHALNSFESFAESRNLTSWLKEDPTIRSSLLSELFTFPLTISRFINQQPSHKKFHTIHIIGARAEATLPDAYWMELFNTTNGLDDSLSLEFIGLDVPHFLKTRKISIPSSNQMLTRKYTSGEYNMEPKSSPSLAVFFNPGFAHAPANWENTVKQVVQFDIPVLVTGFNDEDAKRDTRVAQDLFGIRNLEKPQENPFASMKTHEEGKTGRFARSNHFVWGWNWI